MELSFNSMQDALDKRLSAAKGVVSGVVVERQPFMSGFVRLCDDGWYQGWHERNGGNLTYRLTDQETAACRPYFLEQPGEWVGMNVQVNNLRGACFATTGAGCYLRNVSSDIAHNVGLVEIDAAGAAYRVVWGLVGGGRPTSEFFSHCLNHDVRMAATEESCRVMYHAHPDNTIALTKVMPLDARTFTRALWKATTESVIAFPAGVGVVDCMVPGSMELARSTSELMRVYDAVIWAQHGVFASGSDFDSAFGLMHAIEKAAKIHAQALLLNGGSSDFPNTIPDDLLRAMAHELDLPLNEAFLG